MACSSTHEEDEAKRELFGEYSLVTVALIPDLTIDSRSNGLETTQWYKFSCFPSTLPLLQLRKGKKKATISASERMGNGD
jgi:hypothetical protein